MWGVENWGLAVFAGVLALIGSMFYVWGGTEDTPTPKLAGKYWRRFIGSAVIGLAPALISLILGMWDWRYILMYPGLVIVFSLGYGGDTQTKKIIRRTIFAIGCVAVGLIGVWIHQWNDVSRCIMIMQAVIGFGSIYLGVKNPYKSAPVEQFLVCLLLTVTIPFWPWIG